MTDFSEQKIKSDCPHCDPDSFALAHKIKETNKFWVACDVHPLTEGHLLIIPKQHLSCIGEYPSDVYNEFLDLYETYLRVLNSNYGTIAAFEHGKIGQTVFHSHVHLLPFDGRPENIIPEDLGKIKSIENISELKEIYRTQDKYLFFAIGPAMWVVDTSLGTPRFFRDRFARALGQPERGNWKEMHTNPVLMRQAEKEILYTKAKLGV